AREYFLSVCARLQRKRKPTENPIEERAGKSAVVKSEGLTKSFSGHTLFNDLTLEFPQGNLTVIMGPSGCGKSTLLRCINFLELFDSGRISIGDLSVAWGNGESGDLPFEKKQLLQKMRLRTG